MVEWTNELMYDMNELQWTNEWHAQMNKRTNERMDDWMNEWDVMVSVLSPPQRLQKGETGTETERETEKTGRARISSTFPEISARSSFSDEY